MRTGQLRHRVTIERPTLAADEFGEMRPTYSSVGTYWAEVRGLSGKESEIASQLRVDATSRVRLRGKIDIRASDRVLFGARVLNVVWIMDEDSRGIETRAFCSEVQQGG
jgi:SPP1 family predicted phage head-tail adaptor